MDFTTLQQKFIDAYKESALSKKFYLTGGTLLAVRYLNHRKSLDLDFFTDQKFSLSEIEPLVAAISKRARVVLGEFRRIADRFEWEIADKRDHVKIEFVFYDFKPLRGRIAWKGIVIDNLYDATANKTFALIERHEPKDIFDLYFIMKKKGWTVKKLLTMLKKKFGITMTPQIFFSQAELAMKRLDAMKGLLLVRDAKTQGKLIDKIHNFFDKEARKYLRYAWEE